MILIQINLLFTLKIVQWNCDHYVSNFIQHKRLTPTLYLQESNIYNSLGI